MGILAVIVAALAGWMFGAAWYMTLSKPWMAAANIETDANGKQVNESATPYILSALAMVLVAGMMRHTFATTTIDTVWEGAVSGLGIGLFFISPWIMINNAYANRPFTLTLIDGGYATFGCTIIGAVLMLF